MIEEWQWVSEEDALKIHRKQIERYGGLPGIRDTNVLSSALARPVNLNGYEGVDDPIILASSYAFGIVRNHPFSDGNKRTAFVAAAFFLDSCGFDLETSQKDVIDTILTLASGELTETEFAEWLRGVSAPRK